MKKIVFIFLLIPFFSGMAPNLAHAKKVTVNAKYYIDSYCTAVSKCSYNWGCTLAPEGWQPGGVSSVPLSNSLYGWQLPSSRVFTTYAIIDIGSVKSSPNFNVYSISQGSADKTFPPLTVDVGSGWKNATLVCVPAESYGDLWVTNATSWPTQLNVIPLYTPATASLTISKSQLTLTGTGDGMLTDSVELTYQGCNTGGGSGGTGGGIKWSTPVPGDERSRTTLGRLHVDWGTPGDYGNNMDCRPHTTNIKVSFDPQRLESGAYNYTITFYLEVM